MADSAAAKHAVPVISDIKSLISIHKTRRTVAFLYGFMFASLVVTIFFAFSPSANSAAPWLTNVFSIGSTANNGVAPDSSPSSYRSQFSSIFSYLFPNGSSPSPPLGFYSAFTPPPKSQSPPTTATPTKVSEARNSSRSDNQISDNKSQASAKNQTSIEARNNASSVPSLNQTARSSSNSDQSKVSRSNQTQSLSNSDKSKASRSNQTQSTSNSDKSKASRSNQTQSTSNSDKSKASPSNQTQSTSNSGDSKASRSNQTAISAPQTPVATANKTISSPKKNDPSSFSEEKKSSSGKSSGVSAEHGKKVDDPLETLRKCDFFDGQWVRDDSYGLYYKPGSCSLVDEQFNCVGNGRPDKDFQKYKWKPKGCSLPRLDGKKLLEMLRGKRLVFVGDSLNRNMWESLVCILKNSVKDPSKVFEAHGRHNFRAEASYSFIFKDYGCTVEFFVSPFLVQEWEAKDKNGTAKETLRLDMMSKSALHYKTADVIVFNTGHWWTHEKTSKGEDYYQEGDRVYKELNVLEAFRKAITTWGKWVDANVNPSKSLVFFRGYSHSHFSGGQWNSGGACNSETVPIKNETYLRPYLPKMIVLEKVLGGMKTQVTYLNVTKMTDFRKDAHPSIYRRQNAPEEERKAPLKYQDCSHWCLPGVPDTWNEVLYAELLVKFGQKGQQQQQQKKS